MTLRILVVATLLVFAGAPPASAYDPACSANDVTLGSTPAAPQTSAGRLAFEEQRVRFSQPADIVLMGDSLTARWPADALSSLGPARVLNAGVDGDGVQHLLWRLLHYPMENVSPKVATVLIGTNNLGVGNAECVVEVGLDLILARVSAIWPRTEVLLLGIPKRGPRLDFRDADREAANRYLRTLAAKTSRFHYVDLDGPLHCASPAACAYYKPDMLHLDMAAYATLTRLLRTTP